MLGKTLLHTEVSKCLSALLDLLLGQNRKAAPFEERLRREDRLQLFPKSH